jgi:hypothetical protein
MSTTNIAIETQRKSRPRDARRTPNATARVWECVPTRRRLTASEFAVTIYGPRAKIHRDFSHEIARARRWHSARVG